MLANRSSIRVAEARKGTVVAAHPASLNGARRLPAPPRRATLVETLVQEVGEEYSIDVAALGKKLEARAKAYIALEEAEIQTRPLVRIQIHKQLGLGDAWKVVGSLPEFGRFTTWNAPFMKWSNGHVWTYEARVRPGRWHYKLVMRRADGAYIWEEGPDRVLEVPAHLGKTDVIEIRLNEAKLPQ